MKGSRGYQGAAIMRPEAGHPQIFSIVAHFSSQADLDAWTSSELRGRLVAEADEVSIGGLNVQQAAGLEAWFQLPGQPIVVPPPRYKMAVVTWVALLPLLIVTNLVATPVLAPLPPILRLVPISMVLVGLMTWAVMPLMTKAFRFWLYP
jgi:antibiotic biosynthesis monooxygenase (ABM) superfamily enzyme